MVPHRIEVRDINDSIAVGVRAESVVLQPKVVAHGVEVKNVHDAVAVRVPLDAGRNALDDINASAPVRVRRADHEIVGERGNGPAEEFEGIA